MKRSLCLFCIAVAALFIACKKDHESQSGPLMVRFVNKSESWFSNLKIGNLDIGRLPQNVTTNYFPIDSIYVMGNSALLSASGNADADRTIVPMGYCGTPPLPPATTLRNGKHTIYIKVSPTIDKYCVLSFEIK
ncbi:hypothetical protein [Chitinophaga vietnamensis]|uniref:hypothetical protein n=1 Tax=Chitinophaga vietnamensis TaxID=2593957 RepID=UPI0011788161|nr:hypothetical protein [Chitinophaga vietnamensis]